jgi:ribosomal protein S18 acetylase RimI-like enzyme
MKIRLATVEDARGMARVIVDTFLAANRGVLSEEAWQRRKEEWTHEVSARNWEASINEIASGASPNECIYVAEDETGAIVGLAMGCPSSDESAAKNGGLKAIGEVNVLYVSESHQRQGIGRSLVQATAAHLARFGMTKLRIVTPEANTEGRVFYEKIGGHIVGMRADYNDGELIPLVVYEWPDIHIFAATNERGQPQ